MTKYALRVDIKKKDALKFIELFRSKFSTTNSLFTFEISKVEKKPHIHAYYISDKIKKQTLSDFMKKNGLKGKYSNTEVTDENKYKLYIMKDLDILYTDLSEEEMDSLYEKTQDINFEKSSKKHELLLNYHSNRCLENDLVFGDKKEIIRSIGLYHKENPRSLPPNKSQLFQYYSYITLQDDLETWVESMNNIL